MRLYGFQQATSRIRWEFYRIFHIPFEREIFSCGITLFSFYPRNAPIYPQTFPHPVENFYPRILGHVVSAPYFGTTYDISATFQWHLSNLSLSSQQIAVWRDIFYGFFTGKSAILTLSRKFSTECGKTCGKHSSTGFEKSLTGLKNLILLNFLAWFFS